MGLVLVRHTQPDVKEGVCYGHTDLALADSFETEATAVLKKIEQAEVLVSSPLLRCRQLANKIGAKLNLAVTLDDRLREMDFGCWEGVMWESIPREELDSWSEKFYTARPHGGESVEMLHSRVKSAIAEFQKTGRSYIIVCHAGVIKAATANGTDAEAFSIQVPLGGILELKPTTNPDND